MRLFIAPKRDVALSISVALGGPSTPSGASFKFDDEEVTWLSGHLLRLTNPQEFNEGYETWSLDDLPMNWPISYLPDDRHKQQLASVIELAKQADELVNAGDPDPEGQRLVDEIIEYAGLESKPMARLLINDNNPMAILKASLSMRNNINYRGLSLSALARSVCDQRYGFNLTRAYTLLARQQGYIGVLSVGRVQTPILGLIVSRDKAHQSHEPETYYEVVVDVNIRDSVIPCKYLAKLDGATQTPSDDQQIDFVSEASAAKLTPFSISDQVLATKIINEVRGKTVTLLSSSAEDISTPAPLPHSLLSLQAEAAGRYGYKPSQVHHIAQKLRDDHMAITYHRSDSRYLNNERFREAPALLDALSGQYAEWIASCNKKLRSDAFNSEKVTSHHAVIPTLNVPAPDSLNEEEQHIYDLITRAYVAQFYEAETNRVTSLVFDIGGHTFTAANKLPKQKGWRSILGDDYETESDLAVRPSSYWIDVVDLESITRFDHGNVQQANILTQTTAGPERYTMKTLLQDLSNVAQYVTDPAIKQLLIEKDSAKQDESGGIGTPATRDKHIETLFARGFIAENGAHITSTAIGRNFCDALPDFAVKPDMTALWHQKQKQIESGEIDYKAFINDVDAIIAKEVDRAKRVGLKIKVKPVECPSCSQGHLVLRTSKESKQFWGCSAFPACRTTFSDVKGRPDIK